MTWKEIKQAIEQAGISESDEICSIECACRDGDKVLHKAKSGKMFKLAEHLSEEKSDAHGCAS